jgi:two-component system response regulator FlrC
MQTVLPPRILVVEDDQPVRRALRRHLDRFGFRVDEAESAEEAMSRMERCAYDLVLMDVHLPGMSGVELVGQLAAEQPEAPIVLMSGDPDCGIRFEGLTAGAAAFLRKPFESSQLYDVLTDVITRD